MVKQVLQDTFEGLKEQVKDVVDSGKRESVNIVKEIFKAKGSDEKGLSGSVSQAQVKQQQQVQDQQQLVKARQQQQYLVKQAARLRQIEQEEEAESTKEEQEEQQQEQSQVVQLRKAEKKKETLQKKHIRTMQGTREAGPRKRW
jgi:hypothetical protein